MRRRSPERRNRLDNATPPPLDETRGFDFPAQRSGGEIGTRRGEATVEYGCVQGKKLSGGWRFQEGSSVIASEAKQSIQPFDCRKRHMDCFVAALLAMMERRVRSGMRITHQSA
jgi:hypothetical protein